MMKQTSYFMIPMAILMLTLCSLANTALAERHPLYIGYKLPENTDLIYEARRLEANALSQRNIEIQACANGNDATRCEQQAEIAFRRRISAIPGAYFILAYQKNEENNLNFLMNFTASEAVDTYLDQEFNHLQPEVVDRMGINMETSNCKLVRSNGDHNPISYHNQNFTKLVCQMIQQDMEASTLLWQFVDSENNMQLSKHEDDVVFLLNHGADPNFNFFSEAILSMASQGDHVSVAKLLIAYGADIDAKNDTGNTALSYVGSVEMAQLLIKNHADVNSKNDFGAAPLEFAWSLDIAKLLVENGADINAADKYGRTALLSAASNGYKAIVEFLLQKGAAINQKDNEGHTALYFAKKNGNTSLAELLRLHGGTD